MVEVGVHGAAGRQPRPQHLVHGQGGEAGPVAEPRPLPLLPAVEPLNCDINTLRKACTTALLHSAALNVTVEVLYPLVVVLVLVELVVEAVLALLVVDPHTRGEEELALPPEVDSPEAAGGGQVETQQQQRRQHGDHTAGWGHISHHDSGFYWFEMTALGGRL